MISEIFVSHNTYSLCAKRNMKKDPFQSMNQVKTQCLEGLDHCFLNSSLYYGGPDENYTSPEK